MALDRLTKESAAEELEDLHNEMLGGRLASGQIDVGLAEKLIPRSDLTAARIIYKNFGARLTWLSGHQEWHYWNGVYHENVKSDAIADWIVHAFVDSLNNAMTAVSQHYEQLVLAAEAAGATRGQIDKIRDEYSKWRFGKHRAFRDKMNNAGGIQAVASVVKRLCTKQPDFFDEDRRWCVVENGVIDLEEFRWTKQVALLPHDSRRPVTRMMETRLDTSAEYGWWEYFLARSLPDEELREYLQRLVGAAWLAESKVKVIANLQGPQDSGKTVFVSTLRRLFGGYGVEPQADALMQAPGGGTNFEQDTIRGKRFVGISEPSVTSKLDDSFCKKVTGGDPVQTRTLNVKSTEWQPQCVIFIASNQVVRLNTSDDAFLNRIGLVRFPYQFWDEADLPEGDDHRKIKELESYLTAQSPGILNWVIEGARRFVEHGISTPTQVKTERKGMRVEGSTALRWLQYEVEQGWILVDSEPVRPMSNYMLVSDAYSKYEMWCLREGEKKPLTRLYFKRHIEGEYGESKNSKGWRLPRIYDALNAEVVGHPDEFRDL